MKKSKQIKETENMSKKSDKAAATAVEPVLIVLRCDPNTLKHRQGWYIHPDLKRMQREMM